jgi:hypothetical protein
MGFQIFTISALKRFQIEFFGSLFLLLSIYPPTTSGSAVLALGNFGGDQKQGIIRICTEHGDHFETKAGVCPKGIFLKEPIVPGCVCFQGMWEYWYISLKYIAIHSHVAIERYKNILSHSICYFFYFPIAGFSIQHFVTTRLMFSTVSRGKSSATKLTSK